MGNQLKQIAEIIQSIGLKNINDACLEDLEDEIEKKKQINK